MTPSEVLAFVSMCCAALASVVNFAASRLAPRPWARIYLTTGLIAIVYVAAFAWLLIPPHNADVHGRRGQWSEFMTPMTIASFLVVWTAPAAASWIRHHGRPQPPNPDDRFYG